MAREFGRRAQPVNRHWTPFTGSFGAQPAGTLALTLSAAQHDRETLLRTRGHILAYLDGVNEPAVAANVAVGMILVPEGTGTTVLWSPQTDGDAPWFWYESFTLAYEEGVVNVLEYAGVSVFRQVIDSKGMRRIRNQEVQLVIEVTTIQSAIEVNLMVSGRFLTQE